MTKQEENWELYTLVGVPWKECNDLSDEDREYLMGKADEIKKTIMDNRRQEDEMRRRMQADSRSSTVS
jgi:hypothetical protein